MIYSNRRETDKPDRRTKKKAGRKTQKPKRGNITRRPMSSIRTIRKIRRIRIRRQTTRRKRTNWKEQRTTTIRHINKIGRNTT